MKRIAISAAALIGGIALGALGSLLFLGLSI